MASIDKPETEHVATAPPAAEEAPAVVSATPEPEKGTALPTEAPPEYKTEATPNTYLGVVELVLRFILFAATLVAVVVIVTSKQTELIPTPFPPIQIRYSSVRCYIVFLYMHFCRYFVAALSVAGLYSIMSTLLSALALLKPGFGKQLVSHFVVIDVLLLGIVAAATGAAGGVTYIGLRGNSHSRWNKICNRYDTFCQHLAGAIAASLFASILLVLLILLSVFTLSRKIPK